MGYDKDWEVYLALNDPNDPIHGYIEEQIEEKTDELRVQNDQRFSRTTSRPKNASVKKGDNSIGGKSLG